MFSMTRQYLPDAYTYCLSHTRRSGTFSLSQIESVLGSRSVLCTCREIAEFSEELV